MKKAGSIFLLILLVLLGTIIYLNTNIRNDKYVLNQDLITQVKENVPQYTTLDKIPPNFTKAIVAVEDHRFYKHHGFDMQSIARALYINMKQGSVKEGGSTITQQLAKNLFLSSDRTYTRKAKELLIAVRLEQLYSKQEILEMYINVIYYGSGAYGIQAASHTYFGKDASDLTLEECAMLAGLPQAPSVYNPKTNPSVALKRQKTVLSLMH